MFENILLKSNFEKKYVYYKLHRHITDAIHCGEHSMSRRVRLRIPITPPTTT